MSKPKAPPPPDYAAAATAQGAANVDAARAGAKLSNPNIINPYGSQTVTYGANGDQDQATVTQSLSPEQQKLFDQDIRISTGLGNLAEGGISRVGGMLGSSFNPSGLPTMNPDVSGANTDSMSGRITTDIAPTSTSLQSAIADPRRGVQYGFGQPSTAIQSAVDSRFDQTGDQVQEALYRKQTSMLDPQYQQQESDMISRLANQGIMPGSEAYNREMANFARNREFAYGNARDSAILAGGNEQSRLYQMGLAGAGLANNANQQEFGQGLARAGFGNEANAQEFQQNATKAGFNNATQGQEFEQNAARAGFNNSAIGQMFGQQLQANSQNFNQGLASAQFGNEARQQALQEQLALRQLPLNEINALRSGAQVTVPQFQQYTGQNVQAAPIFQGAQAQANWDQGIYNAKAAQSGNMMSGLFSLGSAALLSDVRAKENIKRVGFTDGGLPVYTYNYIGDNVRHMGVIAQEVGKVNPDAVLTHESGFLMVDYSKVK